MDEVASQLKQRALSLMGEATYNEGGADVPSAQVDLWFDAVLREFLGIFPWSWAVVTADAAPDAADVLVMHAARVEEKEWLYVPSSITCVPADRPLCQLAFCYLLAARVAACVTSAFHALGMMEQQYARYLSEARYADAAEICRAGKGAITRKGAFV